MMEGYNQTEQEDYIWAMRSISYKENDESWKQRRASPILSQKSAAIDVTKTEAEIRRETQTKLMASLVPDEVIYNLKDYSHRHYECCFLFGDVSGFTELCEKYSKTGQAGSSRLTQVLNSYIGSMVQEIMSYGGDILKFSGDAFLAMWKCSEDETMRDSVRSCIDCALVIQKTYGTYLTDVGVVIRVKLAISAGEGIFALIGDEKNSHYVIVGQPIWDVKAGEKKSVAGDIIVSPAAWHYTNSNEYLATEMSDGKHMKILGAGPNWRSLQKHVRQQHDQHPEILLEDQGSETSSGSTATDEEFALRPAVEAAVKLNIRKDLPRFIIQPVMKSIHMNEPFEYLTEMRQVVVVFINVISHKIEIEQYVNVADQTYRIVCRVVDEAKGCVNKVSLFDKDLMLVVIFGLRGLKQETESQVALKCASECMEEITKLELVASCSIGVTTGKTYCGVVGHTLRREYTVISLTVNKAARLMVNYQDKVSCDRETFLHSKMEAKNFLLLPTKALKGITHPGPVYEFKEIFIHYDINKVSNFPLLGRDEELKEYLDLLNECFNRRNMSDASSRNYKKILLIHSEARQGKTRLLEEIIYMTPQAVYINSFTLNRGDSEIPYKTIKLIFGEPLGLSLDSPVSEKEDKLLITLKGLAKSEMICALNAVFSVNFRVSRAYREMSRDTQDDTLHQLMEELCRRCFTLKWLIAIDNTEHVDEDSWPFMEILLEMRTVCFILTRCLNRPALPNAKKFLADRRVKEIRLKGIDRWYHGGLACQFLDVSAISPEMENAIQVMSNGNPGYIESFLISLVQDDGLDIIEATLRKVEELGLVIPPLYMMARLTPEEAQQWKYVMEEKKMTTYGAPNVHWKKFVDTCRGSYLNVVVRGKLENNLKTPATVDVCLISKTFNIADIDPELSEDVIILKIFDSLTSYEQLLIKCSAILGVQFQRDMLLYVMSNTNVRLAAIAVQKLFEIKVLTCARGDFRDNGNVLYVERLKNPNLDIEPNCECQGNLIEESCLDLPHYANCGSMQFRSIQFRDITYNLLTDSQKKEFHFRAMRYLEKETRRCRACGHAFFDNILGGRKEIDVYRRRRLKRETSAVWDEMSVGSILQRTSVGTLGTYSTLRKTSGNQRESFSASVSDFTMAAFETSKDQYKMFDARLGVSLINQLKSSLSLTRSFSNEDFSDCTCNLILICTYLQLVKHCKGAGVYSKTVEAMLEFTHVNMVNHNSPMALKTLSDCLVLLRTKRGQVMDTDWKETMMLGRIYMMQGRIMSEIGHIDEALLLLYHSLIIYGYRLPRTDLHKKLRIKSRILKLYFGLYLIPETLTDDTLDYWETVFCNHLAETLNHMCELYQLREMWLDAELVAVCSLTKALLALTDFRIICTSYANMIAVMQHFHKFKFTIALEVHSLRFCHVKMHVIEAEELKAVSMLYTQIFHARFFRSNLEASVHIGYIVLKICSSVHATKIILPILPELMRLFLFTKQVNEAISIVHELDFFAGEDSDSTGRIWYYAICITFHLETGYTMVSYKEAEQFYLVEEDNLVTVRDPDARKRFYAVMWLWCVRNEKWEAADIWEPKTKDCRVIEENDTICRKFTALYLLEGMIACLAHRMDKQNIEGIDQLQKAIDTLIKCMERSAGITQCLLPRCETFFVIVRKWVEYCDDTADHNRLYHMKSYYRMVVYNDDKAYSLLRKGRKYAVKFNNLNERSWMDHNEKAWTKRLSDIMADFWREHSDPDNMLSYLELELNGGIIGYFTLVPPVYV